jgi:hypothetical protein
MWFLGISLFAHVVSYFGISYFDNVKNYWCAFLAIVAAATAPLLATQKVEVEVPQVLKQPKLRISPAYRLPTVPSRQGR